MEKAHKYLKIFIFVQLGACVGRILAKYYDYVKHPGLYAMQSAPWYLGVLITVCLTAVTVLLTTIAYFVIGHMIKRKKNRTDSSEE